MTAAVTVEGLGKKFRKGARGWMGQGSLRDALTGLFTRDGVPGREEFWALRDVTFEVSRGDALGILGPNGAGKSTMLKILARILRADEGRVAVNGSLSALIEVGAGFHPELTGRENIFLNGSILGLSRKEVQKRFDDIVSFAELEDFIDTPVKRYSSGMYVRLGFSVAAHVDPDILLVDEVLSVGDIRFRQKCLTHIGTLRERGTTMILVSHNVHTILTTCTQALALFEGQVEKMGDPEEVVGYYKTAMARPRATDTEDASRVSRTDPEAPIVITDVELVDADGRPRTQFGAGEPMWLRLHYHAREQIPNPIFGFGMSTEGLAYWGTTTKLDGHALQPVRGEGCISLRLSSASLLPNHYVVTAGIWADEGKVQLASDMSAATFVVNGPHTDLGIAHLEHAWEELP